MMKLIKTFKLISVLAVLITAISCSEDEPSVVRSAQCGEFVVLSTSGYNGTPSSSFSILEAELVEDCLTLTVSASGCSGNTWQGTIYAADYEIVNAEVVFDARLDVVNIEACTAVPSTEMVFDVSSLQVSGENSVMISIDGWNADLVYSY
ncbi:hypothetical protein [Neptunitalea lumnitzerae]|uniref:Lipocalin-like domain-containing protein n=1 Tax=Neptunitalea lumnitzerae TaxID=2965509 RepID=A0ABQ5MLH5_9FLAO|nr:hypothetical protein [Neptunitalea sp. Y10]GLB50156.1 hypothetical protein Y10_25240 [Neptunitalea sp. Y10]